MHCDPILSIEQSVGQPGGTRSDMTTEGPRVVLVVEDDDGMREAIESLLGAAGFDTAAYTSAEAMFAGESVDRSLCVISDLHLPAMSGLDLLTELRKRGAMTPVIVITGFDTAATREEAASRGAAAYLAKPFEGRALLAAIDSISAQAGQT
jgi:FixJ family two-component response regulator